MSILGIIPARGGSKRIPNKNITLICGRPIMGNILSAAEKSGIFDTIHVSTDCKKVASVANDLGFRPDFLRDPALADDHTPLQPVLKWVVEKFAEHGRVFDVVYLLMPCALLVQAEDLIRGLEIFKKFGGKKPLMAMAPYPVPVEWAFNMEKDGLISAVNPDALNIRSQDLTVKYYDAGLFDIYSREHLTEEKNIGEFEFVSIIVEAFKAIDIDTPEDLVFAEALYRGLQYDLSYSTKYR